ncbi:MAG: iron-containing alcohol dehydrogenase, partial [Syntrophus sp. (in: bacteria)]
MHKIFSFTGARKIVFGNGSFQQLPQHIRELQAKRPLIVLDKQLAATGMKEQVVELLTKNGMECQIFDKVDPEPKISLADEG